MARASRAPATGASAAMATAALGGYGRRMDGRAPHTGRQPTGRARRLFVGWALFAALALTLCLGGAGMSLSKPPAEAAARLPSVVIAECAAGEGLKPALAAWSPGRHDVAATSALPLRVADRAVSPPLGDRRQFAPPSSDGARPGPPCAYEATGPPHLSGTARA